MAENNSKLRKKKAYTVKVNILTEVKKKWHAIPCNFEKQHPHCASTVHSQALNGKN